MAKVDNWRVFGGFELEVMATGLDLPANLAFVPNPGDDPKSPLLYVTELYGQVKAITNDWSVHTYADNLLNFKPDGHFPGSGEIDPSTGRPAGNIYRVKAKKKLATATINGIVLAESGKYEIVESNVYFPPDSVNWQYFTRSGDIGISPVIGESVTYTLSAGDVLEKNAAWSFADPKEGFTHIRGYLAFGFGEISLLTEKS